MKKTVMLCSLFLCSLFASAETYVPGASVFGKIGGAGLTWASGVNNTWVIDSVSTSGGVCLTVQNNDTSAHTFTLAGYVTSDQGLKVLGTAVKWQQVGLSPPATSTGYSVPATSVMQIFVRAIAAFHVALQFGGGSGTGTADIYFAQTGASCGSVNQWTQVGSSGGLAVATYAAVPGVRHVINCIDFSANGTATAANNNLQVNIRDNDSGSTCTGGTPIYIHGFAIAAALTNQSVNLCGLNLPGGVGHSVTACFTASVSGLVENVFFSGFDSQ